MPSLPRRVRPLLLPAAWFVAGVLLAAGGLPARQCPPGARLLLTLGELSDHWVVTGCQAQLCDGVLELLAGNGLVRTHHPQRDFLLRLEWKPQRKEKYDSGIYFRAPLPEPGRPWPPGYQINLLQGHEGQVGGLPGARPRPDLVKPGCWNRMELLVQGDRAQLKINGRLAWGVSGLKRSWGYVGLQAEVPGGGRFAFRNVELVELAHRPLLTPDGFSEHWEPADPRRGQCWKMDRDLLLCTGERGTWLRSRKQYADFNLRLQYRLQPGGNSGVYVRVPRSGEHRGRSLGEKDAGVEIQILDDAAPRYKNLKPYQYSASVYAIVPARPRVAHPAGKWNSLEIDCRGTRYRIWHNGHLVVDADAKSHPELAQRRLKGYLGLQNHSEPVWFRQVRIGPPLPQ